MRPVGIIFPLIQLVPSTSSPSPDEELYNGDYALQVSMVPQKLENTTNQEVRGAILYSFTSHCYSSTFPSSSSKS